MSWFGSRFGKYSSIKRKDYKTCLGGFSENLDREPKPELCQAPISPKARALLPRYYSYLFLGQGNNKRDSNELNPFLSFWQFLYLPIFPVAALFAFLVGEVSMYKSNLVPKSPFVASSVKRFEIEVFFLITVNLR